jgi:RNA polymerase subunit RPABC4/transcription elongation factor Spt4
MPKKMSDHENNVICIKCKYIDALQFPICPACLYRKCEDTLRKWNTMVGISNAEKDE